MPIRVLIADDQEDVRRALAAVIRAEPSLELVGEAADAAEAVELAVRHRPQVAILDVKMPAGGGSRAARDILRLSPATRVVALSAYDDRSSVLEMLRAGAVGYLVKGASADEIRETVERCARGGSVLAPEVAGDVVREMADRLQEDLAREERERALARRIEDEIAAGIAVVLQPIVDLATRAVVGFEALARFREGSPEEWLGRASQVGLRVDLELAALRAALPSLRSLPEEAFLAVNLSPGVLTAAPVRAELASTPLERLVVETTEHAPVEDYEALREALAGLRARGLRLAVDDAGAGFASLRHVLRLEPDIIKVDRSLIAGIERDRAARALASALIAFASEMGQLVIAEGIESESALAALVALGVTHGQGYAIARPAPLAALVCRLRGEGGGPACAVL